VSYTPNPNTMKVKTELMLVEDGIKQAIGTLRTGLITRLADDVRDGYLTPDHADTLEAGSYEIENDIAGQTKDLVGSVAAWCCGMEFLYRTGTDFSVPEKVFSQFYLMYRKPEELDLGLDIWMPIIAGVLSHSTDPADKKARETDVAIFELALALIRYVYQRTPDFPLLKRRIKTENGKVLVCYGKLKLQVG
jgi:hypothetical protein